MKKRKIWLKRLIPLAFLLIYTVGMSEIFYRTQIHSVTERCWEELAMNRDDITREVGTQLNTNLTLLSLASDAIMMNADFSDESTVLEYLETVQGETIFDRIDVFFPDGSILVQSTGQRVAGSGELSFEALAERGTHLSTRVTDFLSGDPAIHAFSPIVDETGTPIALLGATIYCRTMGDLFSSSHYGDDAQLFLVDRRDGNLVVDKWHEQPGSIYDMQGYVKPDQHDGKDLVAEIMAGNTGRLSYKSEHYGKTSYTIYAPIANTDFSLAMVLQEDVAMADLKDQKAAFTWVGIVEMILLFIFVVWVYFIMRRSMQNERRIQQAEMELLNRKEKELQLQLEKAAERQDFLETMGVNVPGGYHRCSTDNGFILSFVSNSFTEITGYTAEQLEAEADNSYINLVAPEDRDYFMSLEPVLAREGRIDCAYRIVRRDGNLRWVQDSTQKVVKDGEQYYQCTLADIHDFVHELNEAKQAAEASSQAKSTFLFNASHDIRTPMSAILGFAHIIKENYDDPAVVSDTIDKVMQSGHTLMTLLNDVLELSRIERGKEELNPEVICLSEHGQNLYEMFAADMEAAGITFVREEDISHTHVLCDQLKLSRIGMNFLSNAKKFTPKGGSVLFGVKEIASDETTATYRFYARDTGIGMSEEFREKAFGQFERERTATESGVSGSGLGLSITKRIVDLMGGRVEISSELGMGTEIAAVLTLPLADEDARRETISASEQVDMTGRRVLLVEDNEFNREIAGYILRGMHFDVDEAENGSICVDMLLREDAPLYDLILMDIQMPIMDGYTATSEIRSMKDPRIASIPIIAMTANAFEEDKKKCLAVGMNGHIGKPVDPEDLARELSRVLNTEGV